MSDKIELGNTISACNFKQQPLSINFNDINGKLMGSFFEKDGKLHFEGNADESAKLFVDCVINRAGFKASNEANK